MREIRRDLLYAVAPLKNYRQKRQQLRVDAGVESEGIGVEVMDGLRTVSLICDALSDLTFSTMSVVLYLTMAETLL